MRINGEREPRSRASPNPLAIALLVFFQTLPNSDIFRPSSCVSAVVQTATSLAEETLEALNSMSEKRCALPFYRLSVRSTVSWKE